VFSLNPTFVEIETTDARSFLDLARAGDAEAFSDVCRTYETRLLRQAMMLCGDAAQAEDLAQDTLVEAWRCLRRYNGQCQFFTWLCAILLNRYRNQLRKKRPLPFSAFFRQDHDEFQTSMANLTDDNARPDETIELQEQTAQVRACIQTLPAKHQQVVYLRFYADDSLEGIAAALGCSVGTVKSRLFHALEKLRSMNNIHAQFVENPTKGRSL
jgi:RNA polymerase sigma-70 factor (ECF subfamily)